MADKEIYIDGIRVGHGTSVKGSEETSRSTTITFDGPIQAGLDNIPFSLEIGKLSCTTLEEYIQLDSLLTSMRNTKKTITIKEIIRNENSPFVVYTHYFNCLLDGRDYEMSAEDLTAETLKFAAENMKREYEDL